MKLTPAQADALAVLASDPQREFEGWKRRSTVEGFPRLNMRAGHALVVLALARASWPAYRTPSSVYVHETKYRITAAGIEEHERRNGGEDRGS